MLKKTASGVLGSSKSSTGDPAVSLLGGAHRFGAPYSSHRAPRGYTSDFDSQALLDGLFEHPA